MRLGMKDSDVFSRDFKIEDVKELIRVFKEFGLVNSEKVVDRYMERFYGWDGSIVYGFDIDEDVVGVFEYLDCLSGVVKYDIILGNRFYNVFDGDNCNMDLSEEEMNEILGMIDKW